MKKFALFNDLCYNNEQLYEKGESCHKDQGVNFMKKALFTGAVVTLLCIPSVAYAKATAGVKFEGQKIFCSLNDVEFLEKKPDYTKFSYKAPLI